MAIKVDYKELQNVAKEINAACNTEIKIIGHKKDDLIKEVYDFVKANNGTAPEVAVLYYNNVLLPYVDGAEPPAGDATCDPVDNGTKSGSEATKLGNTLEVLKGKAEALGIEVVDDLSLKGLEQLIFDTLDGLEDEAWLALPKEVTDWDKKMGELVTEQKKQKKREKEESEKKSEKKSARDPKEPRPDFKFSEGTSSFKVMEVFNDLFEKSKGEGVKIADLKDACGKVDIKSTNINSRVTATINYAALPEGGEQVFKNKGLLFPKGHVIEE